MHAEELKHKQIGTVAGIFVTLGLVFGILACMFIASFLQYWLKSFWPIMILFALVVILALYIVKTRLTDYIYLVEKDRITFGRRIGRREKELLYVPFRDILSFGPYGDMESRLDGKKKRYKFTFKKKPDWYVIDCAGCVIILTPTEKYIDCLRESEKTQVILVERKMDTPILDMLKKIADSGDARFCMPGHKGKPGFLGGYINGYDITELPGADNLICPRAPSWNRRS
jgi:hypothetical protein